MKITANNITGIYAPSFVNKQKPVENTQKADIVKNPVSNDEKNFFTSLYPENKEEIMSYHYYSKQGKMSGTALGSLFDKRG